MLTEYLFRSSNELLSDHAIGTDKGVLQSERMDETCIWPRTRQQKIGDGGPRWVQKCYNVGYVRKHNAFVALEETSQQCKEKCEKKDETDNTAHGVESPTENCSSYIALYARAALLSTHTHSGKPPRPPSSASCTGGGRGYG